MGSPTRLRDGDAGSVSTCHPPADTPTSSPSSRPEPSSVSSSARRSPTTATTTTTYGHDYSVTSARALPRRGRGVRVRPPRGGRRRAAGPPQLILPSIGDPARRARTGGRRTPRTVGDWGTWHAATDSSRMICFPARRARRTPAGSSVSGLPARRSPSSPTTASTRCSTAGRSRPASPPPTVARSSSTRTWAWSRRCSTSGRWPRCAATSRSGTPATPRPAAPPGRTPSPRSAGMPSRPWPWRTTAT